MSGVLVARAKWAVAAAVILTATAALAAEGEFHRTLKVNGPVNLQLETGSGSIQVRNGGSTEVEVTGHIRENNWGIFADHPSAGAIQQLEKNPPIQQSGNDIRIGHIDDPELKRGISISYEVVVPSSTNLHSSTGSGTQDISGIS